MGDRVSVGTTRSALIEQGHWLTVRDCKRVLVVVHTVTFAQRLREVFELLETDLRVQLVFTVAPHAFGNGTTEYLRSLGIGTVPWEEARRAEFDLALAAGSRGVHELRAPVVRVSHGAGQIKLLTDVTALAPGEPRPPGMLSRRHLLHEGRLVPAAIVYAHDRDLEELSRTCPEALAVAHVAGDPCVDRILAGLPGRDAYRRALGIEDGQRLVVVTSTWGPASTFGRLDSLLPQLLSQLPDDGYRVAMLVHPNVFAGHGTRQVHRWLSCSRGRGLAVVPPEADWQAPLIAADWIIGDHGSLTAYGTLTEATLLLSAGPRREVSASSPAALLSAVAPVVAPGYPLAEQLDYAAQLHRPGQYDHVAASLSSAPGQFHRRMRSVLYRLLGLGEPARPPLLTPPPPPPELSRWELSAGSGAA
ncbi:hypothetical protein M2163_004031 [Streptomyces sp. SAI-135]|uniref:hypothetical protein n=1 Tax=unclassified Streptomyces TaxID=2593676 RepID=UPI0024770403|nr:MULTISPECIES: hypothetical protein [unclassified Streptomyces]MDH6518982.1 hypothetical protein [Streptomyces sp. SAI-090]MDH6570268.1 hypothetical protein [Streptomyces sp. SAI-117]MDH6616923.1 hypothetical protein [Streptomyces sp. SAI-135]